MDRRRRPRRNPLKEEKRPPVPAGRRRVRRKPRKTPLQRLLEDRRALIAGGAGLLVLILVILLIGKSCKKPAPAVPPYGTVVVTCGAHLEIEYNAQGKILRLVGINGAGKTCVAGTEGLVGKTVTQGLNACLTNAINKQLLGKRQAVAIRVKFGNPVPGEDFLTTLAQNAQLLSDEKALALNILPIVPERLEETGAINMETCKLLAMHFLEAPLLSDVGGDETPVNGLYTFDYEETICTVDIQTGLVTKIN